MPKQRVGDIDIYYEVHGSGPQTLVMVRGLGSNLCAWYEQTPVLARHFRTVVFDNRGAGRTDKPDAPYSMRQMAADTVGLMDALAIDRAALLGISMGGMITQEFALNYPGRLRRVDSRLHEFRRSHCGAGRSRNYLGGDGGG